MATNLNDDKNALAVEEAAFVNDIRSIVSAAKAYTYKTANQMIVISNWLVGRRIVVQEQHGAERAEYGKRVIDIASEALTKTFGKGYGATTLRNYRKFYLTFKDITIQQPLLAVFEKASPAIQQAVVAKSEMAQIKQNIELPTQLSWMHYLCSETSSDMAQYSILNDSKQIYQAKYLTFLPTKEELTKEIEKQKEMFRLQHEG